MSKIGENSYHMMQKEIEKKDDVIKKLKTELAKNCSLKDDIETILTRKITDLETKNKKMIKEEIHQTMKIMEETSKKTYAEIKKQKDNLKSVVKEQKEEEKIEEKDIESRNKNIILHGIVEPLGQIKEKEEEMDRRDIEEILRNIGIQDLKPTHHRIGQKDEKGMKWRPIKVILQSVNDKDRIMKNLYKLKPFNHVGLCITDDFTLNERRKIKEMHQKAKNMNLGKNGDFVWRVRGNPRTANLRLVRKPRIKTQNKLSLTSISDLSDDD